MSLEHSPGRQLIRPREVCKQLGRSRTSLWRDVKAGRFPQPVEIGPNAVAFFADEVEAYKASLPRRAYGGLEPEAV